MLLALLLAAATLADADKAFQAKDYKNAAAAYQEVVGREPDNAAGWFKLGIARHYLGDFQAAADAYEKAKAKGVRSPILAWNLACAYARLGKDEQAFAILGPLVAGGGFKAKALTGDDDLASLRGKPEFAKLVAVAEKNEHPCADAAHRRFDFWAGEWDVLDPQGQKIGQSKVSRIHNDCVLLEEWSSVLGDVGKSFNVYDEAKQQWRQTYVNALGQQTDYVGSFEGNSLPYLANGGTLRMTFTPQGKNVRQHMETRPDAREGTPWTTVFDGLYVPKEKAANRQ